MNWAPLRAVRDGRFKLIDAPRPELYDLEADPGEQTNLAAHRPETARALRVALQRIGGGAGAMSVSSLDREAMEKLAALGYLGAGHSAGPATPGSLAADPKDVIAVFNRLRRANSAVRDRRYAEALPILREVLAEDPGNAFATLVLGSAHMAQGDNASAIRFFKRYLELVPTSAYAHQWLAICHVRRGEQDAALREAEAALAIDPRFSDVRVLKAGVLASRGRHADAVAELRQAIATDPEKLVLRLDLAKVLAEAGRQDEAEQEYRELLQRRPDDPDALVGLGVLEAERGRLAEAEARLRRALERAPGQAAARYDLARVLERQGRADEAREAYQAVAGSDAVPPAVRTAARAALERLSR
jgi:tetratricopeptide (TPR) repeat protein